jgi:hypothetical protein
MRRLAVALFAIAALALSVHSAFAQDAVDFAASSATSDFPDGVVFHLEADADAPPQDIRLIYEVAPDGIRTTAVPDCTGERAIACTFQLAATPRNALIPGAEVTYFWRITSADDVVHESDAQEVTYVDSRFDWQTINDDIITVWYTGSQDDAQALLNAARESLDRNSALLQTTVDFPIKVFFYPSARAMAPAILSDNAEGVITLGEVVYSNTAMVAADAEPLDIARHEIAHIVVRQAVPPPFDVPSWLNEGLAVYSQSEPLGGQRRAVESAIESNSIISVRAMSTASSGSQSNRVSLFYGESWSLVTYLTETYGDQKFADLFRAFAAGSTTSEALQAVYGFDEDGLENEWRDAMGLPPREVPTPRDNQGQTSALPPSGDEGGTSISFIFLLVALTLVLAGGVAAGGIVLARRYR